MEKDPHAPSEDHVHPGPEVPPPFQPDPELVSYRERGKRDDPKADWLASEPRLEPR